jgi:anti-sigma B factor antagonist
MEITTSTERKIYSIQIEGDLDASSSILLDQAIQEALDKKEKIIFVDCTKLHYISSAGLGVFMSYIQEFESSGIQLVIYGLSEKVKNVFKILGLDQLLKIANGREEAKLIINEPQF